MSNWKELNHVVPDGFDKYVLMLCSAGDAKNELILLTRFQKVVRLIYEEHIEQSAQRIAELEAKVERLSKAYNHLKTEFPCGCTYDEQCDLCFEKEEAAEFLNADDIMDNSIPREDVEWLIKDLDRYLNGKVCKTHLKMELKRHLSDFKDKHG